MASRRLSSYNPAQAELFESSAFQLAAPSSHARRTRPSTGRSDLCKAGELVLEFHEAFDLPVAYRPTVDVPAGLVQLRADLLAEELQEMDDALVRRDVVALADALADVAYVLFGTALTFGIDLDAALEEVHRSNMSKLGADGRPVLRPDGKVLKGSRYRPPDMRRALGL